MLMLTLMPFSGVPQCGQLGRTALFKLPTSGLNYKISLMAAKNPDSLNKAVNLLLVLLLAITLTITRPWFRLYEDSSGD